MKKRLFLLLIIILLTSCSANSKINNVTTNEEITTKTTTTAKVYIDDNPIKVGLYQNGKLVTNYNKKFNVHEDIGSFDVCFTNKETLDSIDIKKTFSEYYQTYDNIDEYKIGFYISFMVQNELYEKVILDASNILSLGPYLYYYLYDDINQMDGAWYSHIEPQDMNDDTIFSSIKLYSAEKGPAGRGRSPHFPSASSPRSGGAPGLFPGKSGYPERSRFLSLHTGRSAAALRRRPQPRG
mgnify:CR=1 FL=1